MLGGIGRGLTARVLTLLSLALLPLGAIGLWQTQRIAAQAAAETEIRLVSLTEHAVNPMQGVLQRALGAIEALSPGILALSADADRCGAALDRFVGDAEGYAFAAFLPPDGVMRCSSDGPAFDFSGFPAFQASLASEAPSVTLAPEAPSGGGPVVVVTAPVRDDADRLAGFLSLSMPSDRFVPRASPVADRPIDLLVFNDRGEPLVGGASLADMLPEDASLVALADEGERSFSIRDGDGRARSVAVVAVVPRLVYALASWPPGDRGPMTLGWTAAAGTLPVLMWVASLLVSVFALERLVLRHVRLLGRQMRGFARTRRLLRSPALTGAGEELSAIEADFREMAQSILQDEALLEDNLREKNILLKEIHHRVKNNLQLISSIMNMQARTLKAPEARDVLRRVQDRVTGLAVVHRFLYQSPDLARIDAGPILEDLARQISVTHSEGNPVDFTASVDPVPVGTDEAVPLALLVSEAMTNAVECAAAVAGGAVSLTLTETGEDMGRLVIRNSTHAAEGDAADGLGLKLIRAFVRQLSGTMRTGVEDGRYTMDLVFPRKAARDAPRDY